MDPRVQPHTALATAAFLAVGLACGVGYKPAVSVDQVAESRSPGGVLVDYLEQTAADPAVCDVDRTDGPSIQIATPKLVKAIGKAFAKGRIVPDRWAECTLHLWQGAGPFLREALQDELLSQLRAVVGTGDLAADPLARERAAAVIEVLERRASDNPLPVRDAEKLVGKARKRRETAGEMSTELLDALIIRLELEGGLHDGMPVDSSLIAATSDEVLLAGWAARLPAAELRELAGHRLLVLRLDRQPAAWRVAARDAVLAEGFFAVPETAAITAAVWEPGPGDTVILRLLQNPKMGWVRLLPAGRDASRAADPSIDLRGALKIRVEGIAEPVTLCPSQDRWDPTPCFPPRRLKMIHGLAVLAPTGRIRFSEKMELDDVLRLGSDGERLDVQVIVGGAVAEIDLPIQFDSVPGYEYGVGRAGSRTLVVDVWELSHDRLLIEFRAAGNTRHQLVPHDDASFKIHASMHPDGHYGEGGDIRVRMRCTHCKRVRATLERMITSEPGEVRIRRVNK